ncbi:hypothetical protein CCO0048 [Campylobacter coli RM2228]|nr:hypothetical protein CCO0048 [Campylobacter coli RM2228]
MEAALKMCSMSFMFIMLLPFCNLNLKIFVKIVKL